MNQQILVVCLIICFCKIHSLRSNQRRVLVCSMLNTTTTSANVMKKTHFGIRIATRSEFYVFLQMELLLCLGFQHKLKNLLLKQ